ncbi:FbpB family small basic protein [Caldibacillus lycopersici]|uniref:FbpB family small basic protein n=1 Tax=Perspicuibacillus lycopersici TaxID=1325689 RepID=A0AAE3IS13_9BACI|nr:FbpB family small basic protein [Perspicuibacillus lycopersici]MCU9613157.1 FbpB family small basic protein [Perspicuibacillus lycopersici]
MVKKPINLKELIDKNKEQLLKDYELLEKINEKVDKKIMEKNRSYSY